MGDDFHERLAAHWANLNSMKRMLWNDGVDLAEFGMTRVRIDLFQHALAHPEGSNERFASGCPKSLSFCAVRIPIDVNSSSGGGCWIYVISHHPDLPSSAIISINRRPIAFDLSRHACLALTSKAPFSI